MEIRRPETPAPIHVAQPPQEGQKKQEVWLPRDFHKRLASAHEIAYAELPHQIDLDEQWHDLMRRLVASTTQHGREYAVTVSCIDWHGPLLSNSFEADLFFQEQWGDAHTPIFVSHVSVGTEALAASNTTPSAITWRGDVVPLWRVGGIHTHPRNLPFSDGDMLWVTHPNTNKRFEAVATERFTYLLVRSDAEPHYAHAYLKGRENRFTWPQWMNYQLRPRQTILERNKELAQYCRFGLYQGKPGEPLMRLA